jgi:hypothetical protein
MIDFLRYQILCGLLNAAPALMWLTFPVTQSILYAQRVDRERVAREQARAAE